MTEDSSHDAPDGADIAVVGMAGRFPGADNVDAYWENVQAGVESTTFFSKQELVDAGVRAETLENPNYVRARAVIEDADRFDAGFFGYSPREATLMDPQQRLFLETAWHALESAGHAPDRFDGRIGVYAGSGLNHYFIKHVLGATPTPTGEPDYQSILVNDKDFLTTRVSYKLNLEGPSVVVQTACSTSLVAVHMACQALIGGECEMALAGGVTLRLPQKAGYIFHDEDAYSPDGHCRAFDARAAGCIPGSGVGLVVLKNLQDALDDGDFIHAVVKGTAINNDGGTKVGYTAPRIEGQAEVIRSALLVAGVAADSVGYIEAHGTGTILGDPIEVAALTEAFREETERKQFCALGSVKSNFGHLDAAAGIAAFIKAVSSVRDGTIAPSLHFEEPNPKSDLDSSPFYVNRKLRSWSGEKGEPRRAGVSAFGIGGTNAHAVIQEAPARESAPLSEAPQLLVLSAKSDAALGRTTSRLGRHLEQSSDVNLADVAWTLHQGRTPLSHRHAIVSRNVGEAIERLAVPPPPPKPLVRPAKLAFLFPGQGSQYPGMARDLYRWDRDFAADIDVAAERLRLALDTDLRDVLFAEDGNGAARLDATHVTQPAIFTVSYALARLWRRCGIEPVAMLGHSVGEYVAACIAGVFSFEDALSLVAARGRMMGDLPRGAMLSVPLGEDSLSDHLRGRDISVAAINEPSSTIVSGSFDAIEELQRELREKGLETKRLRTSHAFHSRMMEPVVDRFAEEVSKRKLSAPDIPFVSNVTGTWIEPEQACDPAYWGRHIREPVRFAEGLEAVVASSTPLLVEVGPGRSLSGYVRRHSSLGNRARVWSSTRHPAQTEDDVTVLLEALGELWSAGGSLDWSELGPRRPHRRVPLPTYPFERERYWLPETAPLVSEDNQEASTSRLDFDDWFVATTWKRRPQRYRTESEDSSGSTRWLFFLDAHAMGTAIANELESRGDDVVRVSMGAGFDRASTGEFTIDPGDANDYLELFRTLDDGRDIDHVVHMFSLEPDSVVTGGLTHVDDIQRRGFFSVMYLVQAWSEARQAADRKLTLMTSQVHRVTGDESVCAEKATLVGVCRNVPIEYPFIDARQLDVIWPEEGALPPGWVEALQETYETPILALRGGLVWEPCFESLALEPATGRSLKQDGAYLITGGLGGVGLAVAEHLARTLESPKITLTSRREFPPRATWNDFIAPRGFRLGDDDAYLGEQERRIRLDSSATPMSAVTGLMESLDALCEAHVLSFLERRGVSASQDEDVSTLRTRLGVEPKLRRYFDTMLRVLYDGGRAETSDGTFRRLDRDPVDVDSLESTVVSTHPGFKSIVDLLGHCAREWDTVLSGEAPAIGALYGEQGRPLFDAAIDTVETHSLVDDYRRLVQRLVERIAERDGPAPLRILEVGGGEGRLTESLLPILAGKNVEYRFTDVGTSFVVNADKRFAEHGFDFVRCGVLDISRPPVAQGYPASHFDLVLGFNVVHATSDVARTTGYLKTLLSPGGSVALLESVMPSRWVDLVWGLTDGWWAFEDEWRVSTPLLDLNAWDDVMRRAGFHDVASYPQAPSERGLTDAGLIIGTTDSEIPQNLAIGLEPTVDAQVRKLAELESYGAEVEVVAADVADRNRMHTVLAQIVAQHGTLEGVIHSALVLDDGALQWKTRESVDRVFRPKLKGTLVLSELLAELGIELDFLVLFSSLVSALGGPGQTDYCAVSNFQDMFAVAPPAGIAKRTISIDWGAWREVGLAAESALARGGTPESILLDGMSTEEGIEAFSRILDAPFQQVLVSTRGLDELRLERLADRAHPVSPIATGTEPDDSPSASSTETVLLDLWRELLGIDTVSVDDNFFELGGDSVISLQFIARAKQAGFHFTNSQVFERQTIAELAELASETKPKS